MGFTVRSCLAVLLLAMLAGCWHDDGDDNSTTPALQTAVVEAGFVPRDVQNGERTTLVLSLRDMTPPSFTEEHGPIRFNVSIVASEALQTNESLYWADAIEPFGTANHSWEFTAASQGQWKATVGGQYFLGTPFEGPLRSRSASINVS